MILHGEVHFRGTHAFSCGWHWATSPVLFSVLFGTEFHELLNYTELVISLPQSPRMRGLQVCTPMPSMASADFYFIWKRRAGQVLIMCFIFKKQIIPDCLVAQSLPTLHKDSHGQPCLCYVSVSRVRLSGSSRPLSQTPGTWVL